MSATAGPQPRIEVSEADLEALLARLEASSAAREDVELMKRIVGSYLEVARLLEDKETTIGRLRQLLFGAKSEKKDKVLEGMEGETVQEGTSSRPKPPAKPLPKGHGRNGADAYTGAAKTDVAHETLRPGDPCPNECPGKVYRLKDPARSIWLFGQPPVGGECEERERLRCNVCGEVFTAASPEGTQRGKYDETVGSMVALLRYGVGLPFNRIGGLQDSFGIPLPASTQWDLVYRAAAILTPVHEELRRLAAQGDLVHNDDTPMTILEVDKDVRERLLKGEDPPERTGVYTTGMVAIGDGWRIVLYVTGVRHAGENLRDVLVQRPSGLPPPQQMCDGLDRNLPGELKTILSNCLVHMRRQFVDVVGSFPDEVRHVVEELAKVYRTEAKAREGNMSPEDRLALHQRESAPVMEDLRGWFAELLAEKKVEPNSGLGKAIVYAQKRWDRLTLFLREAGAPLDNNLCERMLKRAILHRKNSLFYKTENGARVGDLYMSLIATAKLARVDPFDYLTEVQKHAEEAASTPSEWLPWTYRATLASRAPEA